MRRLLFLAGVKKVPPRRRALLVGLSLLAVSGLAAWQLWLGPLSPFQGAEAQAPSPGPLWGKVSHSLQTFYDRLGPASPEIADRLWPQEGTEVMQTWTEFDANGYVTRSTTFTRDDAGKLLRQTFSDGRCMETRDAAGKLLDGPRCEQTRSRLDSSSPQDYWRQHFELVMQSGRWSEAGYRADKAGRRTKIFEDRQKPWVTGRAWTRPYIGDLQAKEILRQFEVVEATYQPVRSSSYAVLEDGRQVLVSETQWLLWEVVKAAPSGIFEAR